ncbi:hypothetical protein [Solwaraspora sp. WMMD792]|uniref:hypothetical protein n=1 Tax=Solwaraspora sp. WMMD792 TaxID=3016099 RepID=UPI002417DC40|nr:hypothetical protein [Solwaraspora sp. WMMD792]MDG4771848.1 hypothetical protein [Solwaraspora sp. WMMD792]
MFTTALARVRSLLAAGIVTGVIATAGAVTLAAPPATAGGPTLVPLVTFYSPARGDHFTTSQSAWTCKYFRLAGCAPDPLYHSVGIQGHVFNPDNPRPAGTTPLYHWWSPDRADNFLTTDPNWAGNVGDRKTSGHEYTLFRIEGYVPIALPVGGGMAFYSYWNPATEDNAALATWNRVTGYSSPAPGWGLYRRETGYLLPPESSTLQRCQPPMTTPNHTSDPWSAPGNHVTPWLAEHGLEDGDALRVDATGEIRTDFWGSVKPVHGYSWQHAVPGYPAPGEPPYSLIGSVTAGATFVSGRGWYEAGSWFPIVGTRDTGTPSTSPCLLYEAAGLAGGRFQVTINDNNLSDNGGAATVTVRQWW